MYTEIEQRMSYLEKVLADFIAQSKESFRNMEISYERTNKSFLNLHKDLLNYEALHPKTV